MNLHLFTCNEPLGARSRRSFTAAGCFPCVVLAFCGLGSPAQAGPFDWVKEQLDDAEEVGKQIKDVEEAFSEDEEPLAEQAPDEPAAASNYNADEQRVLLAQDMLNRLGYGAGTVDGVYGPSTKKAIQQYQMDRNLLPRGDVTDALLERLAKEAPQGTPVVAKADPAPTGASAGGNAQTDAIGSSGTATSTSASKDWACLAARNDPGIPDGATLEGECDCGQTGEETWTCSIQWSKGGL